MDIAFLLMTAALIGVTALAAFGLDRIAHRGPRR